ncbi:MAG: hypothetical protein BGN85_12550 [Alphaproteobacteria bacterium 64-11]|nr:hypothetical protein [Alphaproteobacteria bacterium]OJU11357.1 MAG: hypothetical protein BGN85_12550 [Alphaproteobacteria bacterium 64-11]
MRLLVLVVLLFLPGPASAAAWMQKQGTWQVITSAIFTDARHSFGDGGRAGSSTLFQRGLLQTDTQYGLDDRLTLFLRTETANVHVHDISARIGTVSSAFEGGVRYHLGDDVLTGYDVASVEVMGRTAGAFNFSVSANDQAGGEAGGVRLLYGAPFRVGERDGFLNAELGWRWQSRPRPDETVLDLTAGVWLNPVTMVMLQNFNVISGDAMQPYVRYRSHKLQASCVWRWSKRLSLQAGGYFSPAGANALQESGLILSLWTNF